VEAHSLFDIISWNIMKDWNSFETEFNLPVYFEPNAISICDHFKGWKKCKWSKCNITRKMWNGSKPPLDMEGPQWEIVNKQIWKKV